MSLSPAKLLFNVLPEYILLVYVGLGLLGIKATVIDYLKLGVISTLVCWVVRTVLGLYGFHILFMVIFIAVMVKLIINIDFKQSIIASLLGQIMILMGEAIVFYVFIQILNFKLIELMSTNIYYYGFSYLIKMPAIILAILIFKYNFKLINLSGEKLEF